MQHLHEKNKPIYAAKGTVLGYSANPSGRWKMSYKRKGNHREDE